MKFSVGDKVYLEHTGEEGVVTAHIGDQMVMVRVGNTEFPVHTEDISHPYLIWFTNKSRSAPPVVRPEIPVEKKQPVSRPPQGVSLSFMPVLREEGMEEIPVGLKIYLLNELPHPIRFSYEVRIHKESFFMLQSRIEPYGHIYLHDIPYEKMNDRPKFHWQITDASGDGGREEGGVLQLKPAKLAAHIHEAVLHQIPTFSSLLLRDFTIREHLLTEEKSHLRNPPVSKKVSARPVQQRHNPGPPVYELDLHAEKWLDKNDRLSAGEMLHFQLDILNRYLDAAIHCRQERMVIVHGLGKGVLKQAVHEVLKSIPEVSAFYNEWHGKYGFGATEVHFKYGN